MGFIVGLVVGLVIGTVYSLDLKKRAAKVRDKLEAKIKELEGDE